MSKELLQNIKSNVAKEQGFLHYTDLLITAFSKFHVQFVAKCIDETSTRYAEAVTAEKIDLIKRLRQVVQSQLDKEECLSDVMNILEETKHYETI